MNDPEFNQQSGRVGDFLIRTDGFTDSADSMGISSFLSSADDVRFWAGASYANRDSAPFRVTRGGALASTSGVIGGFTIGATTLTAGSGSTFINLDSSGSIFLGVADGAHPDTRVTPGAIKVEGFGPNYWINTSGLTGVLDGGTYTHGGSYSYAINMSLDFTDGTIATALNKKWDLGAASVVSPTSPNRTIRVIVQGTTYYLAAKTTND